ncbi:hypothetical protein B0T17DRAFT_35533 [Bombardia bombarda]|uniref:Gamma-butyrobetaine hydroxylase-like N-terminal domain-containing protein n=1 Tax=Bombardia bombarda TaxID=252184 RepID=A0AA40CE86_9PEZI|nr:hypothetical protein B0T17DRAFT_35533 [Bombardia bombarda]
MTIRYLMQYVPGMGGGGADFVSFSSPNFWLRDMCPCSKCKNPDTKQRSFNTFEVPSTIKVADAEVGQQGKVVRVLC